VRRVAFAAVAAALLLVAVAPVAADTESVSDPKGDAGGYNTSGPSVDILNGTATHAKGGRLVHTVRVAGTADPKRLPLVLIESLEGQSRYCDFVVGRTDRGTGVFTCGYMDKVGSVKIVRRGSKVTYVFKRSAIGDLSEYGWAVVTRGESGGTTVEYDRAPNDLDIFRKYS
jgi:hypothetical protein